MQLSANEHADGMTSHKRVSSSEPLPTSHWSPCLVVNKDARRDDLPLFSCPTLAEARDCRGIQLIVGTDADIVIAVGHSDTFIQGVIYAEGGTGRKPHSRKSSNDIQRLIARTTVNDYPIEVLIVLSEQRCDEPRQLRGTVQCSGDDRDCRLPHGIYTRRLSSLYNGRRRTRILPANSSS